MLASVFVSQGVKGVSDPSSARAQGEMMRDRVAPLLSQVVPASVADRLPQDSVTWARLRGLGQIVAGLGLATGIGRRGAAVCLAAATVQDLIAGGKGVRTLTDPDALGKVALAGGLLLAAQDTEGRPGLGYRTRAVQARVQKKSRKAAKGLEAAQTDAQKATRKALRSTRKKAQRALAS